MPLYEYRCSACGHELEAMQKMSDAPLTECPECGEPALNKLISAAAFRLKGGGWYETDFKHGKKKNLHESNKADSSKETAKEPKKGVKKETKPGTPAAGR
jgi:putative FmdB family regulatory protein